MFGWLVKLWNRITGKAAKPTSPGTARRSAIRRWLAGDAPGLWASDHFEETHRNTGWTFCAVRALGLQFAQATVHCDDPAVARLLHKPNPAQSGAIFRFQVAQQTALTGTAFIWTVRNELGAPVERYVLPTAVTKARGPSAEFPEGSYRVDPLNNYAASWSVDGWQPNTPLHTLAYQGAEIDARDVRPVRWPHPLYLTEGLSPLAAGALPMDVADQIDRARWHALRNRVAPGLIIELSDNVHTDEQEQLEQEVADRNAGPHNSRRNLLLPPGVSATVVDDQSEVEFASSYTQARDAVLALHATPPIAIGVTEAGNYSAFYAALLQYVELTVQPALDLLGDEDTAELGVPVRYTAKRIDDPQLWQTAIDNASRAGAITINEYRARMVPPLPPVPWGDTPAGVRRTDDASPTNAPADTAANDTATGTPDPARRNQPENDSVAQ